MTARITASFLGAALALAGCAQTDAGPVPPVTGQWSGQCSNCPVRSFTLVMSQNGDELTGRLRASGRTGLGESEMPLSDGKVIGRSVTFRVMGADGVPLVARLALSDDGQILDGQGQHRAAFGLTFRRIGQ